MNEIFYNLKSKTLLAFKPVMFFDQINQLDWYQKTLQSWFESNEFVAKSKILDIGCATGALTQFISNSNYHATGVDLSEGMIDISKKNNPDIPYHVADVNNLPFENESFDAVISASVINIVSDRSSALKEMNRVCKNGGEISVLVPLDGFSDLNLNSLQLSLGTTNFSSAALKSWHKLAPKITIKEINDLFLELGLKPQKQNKYLNDMVFSVTASKSS